MLTEGAGWSGSQRSGTSAARLIRGPRRRLRERLLQRSEQREAARGRSGRRGGASALLGRDSGVVEGRGRGGAGSAPGGENAEAALGFEAALRGGVWGPRGAGAK